MVRRQNIELDEYILLNKAVLILRPHKRDFLVYDARTFKQLELFDLETHERTIGLNYVDSRILLQSYDQKKKVILLWLGP